MMGSSKNKFHTHTHIKKACISVVRQLGDALSQLQWHRPNHTGQQSLHKYLIESLYDNMAPNPGSASVIKCQKRCTSHALLHAVATSQLEKQVKDMKWTQIQLRRHVLRSLTYAVQPGWLF